MNETEKVVQFLEEYSALVRKLRCHLVWAVEECWEVVEATEEQVATHLEDVGHS